MAIIKTASTTARVSLKTAFLKTVLFRLFLLIGIAALPSFAFAIDTDGDGVDDSVDAFPNNIEASVDTDGDGKPDWLVQTVEGFETMGTGSTWVSPWSKFGLSSPVRSGSYAHSGSIGVGIGYSSRLKVTLQTSTHFSFWAKRGINGTATGNVLVDGASHAVSYTGSWQKYTIQTTAGSHVIEWPCFCPVSFCDGLQLDDISYSPASTLFEDLDDDNDGLPDVMDPLPLQAKFNLNAPYKGSQVEDQNAVQ